jgi:large subunit ribosomal protein L25
MPEAVIATPREGKFNKNAARRVRVAGKIPAVLYGSGHDPVAVEVDPKQISRILFSETGHNTIFDVEIAGQSAAKAMIVDWQREPIKDQLIHIDMKRIALDKALRVKVAVKLLGVPVGVKASGGILDQVLREVEIECLPADIPANITADVSNLELFASLRVSELPHSDAVKILNAEDADPGRSRGSRSGSRSRRYRSSRAGSGQEGQAGSRSCRRFQKRRLWSEEVSFGRGKRVRCKVQPLSCGGAGQPRPRVSVDAA